MKNFSVIKGKQKKTHKPTREQYKQALNRLVSKEKENIETLNLGNDFLRKFLWLEVKELSFPREKDISYDELELEAKRYFGVTDALSMLTPKEFVQMFPIKKNYDGEKYQEKDYFYVVNAIQKYDPDKPIGDKIEEFLMEYWNWDIIEFQVYKISCMSAARRLMGQSGIMEKWAEKEGIPTYTLYDEEKILVNNSTGEVIKVKKPKSRKPKYLKVVGGII